MVENLEKSDYIEQLKNEVEWINKFREMGIKTPKYFKALSIVDATGQEHHGIYGFSAIFVHMNIAQSTCNASVS
jgi:hypothetical protein